MNENEPIITTLGKRPYFHDSSNIFTTLWSLWRILCWNVKTHFKATKWKNSKAKPGCAYKPTEIEKFANVITHAICVIPAMFAALKLFERSVTSSQLWVSCIYGGSLSMLFLVSTGFHCSCYSHQCDGVKNVLHRFDRAMIYIFMAGSYFPWLHIGDKNHLAALHFVEWIVWAFAIFGIIYQQLYHERFKCLETFFYLLLGVGPSTVILLISNEFHGMFELKIGGLLYILGVYFFKSDGYIPMAHAIWHLFVVIAAAFHYYAILSYLFPLSNI